MWGLTIRPSLWGWTSLWVALGCTQPEDQRVTTHGPVICTNPEARANRGFEVQRIGEDWPRTDDHRTPRWDFLWGARGVSIADFDGDDILDMLVPREGFPTHVLAGVGDATFVDITEDAFEDGLTMNALGSVAVDMDADGDMDAFLYGIRDEPVLLRNNGAARFDIEPIEGWNIDDNDVACGGVLTFADPDRDGDLDGFYGRLGGSNPINGTRLRCESLFVMNDGGELVVHREPVAASVQNMRVITAVWEDFNRDGWIDLYTLTDRTPDRSVLMRNTGDFTFTVPPKSGLELGSFAMGVGIADINRDGLPDVAVPDIQGLPTLVSRNGEPSWVESSDQLGLVLNEERGQYVGWGGEFVDLNSDGWQELVVTYSPAASASRGDFPRNQPDEIYRQTEDHRFVPVGRSWGFDDVAVNRGVVSADLDGDGFMDLVKRELGGVVTIHRNRCSDASWVQIQLDDPDQPNHHAIGARIEIDARGGRQSRTVYAGGTSYTVSGPPRVHFGLGRAAFVERIEVFWPDGEVTSYGRHRARQVLTLRR